MYQISSLTKACLCLAPVMGMFCQAEMTVAGKTLCNGDFNFAIQAAAIRMEQASDALKNHHSYTVEQMMTTYSKALKSIPLDGTSDALKQARQEMLAFLESNEAKLKEDVELWNRGLSDLKEEEIPKYQQAISDEEAFFASAAAKCPAMGFCSRAGARAMVASFNKTSFDSYYKQLEKKQMAANSYLIEFAEKKDTHSIELARTVISANCYDLIAQQLRAKRVPLNKKK